VDEPAAPGPALDRVGVRELRNQVAAVVRRAAAGERVVVTVDGRPVAALGPLSPDGDPTLDDLAASGLVVPPRRPDRPEPPPPVDVPIDVRVADVLDDLRGA
jgi:prevent-host-death family protein